MKDIGKIVLLGSGNVATHLAIALKEAGKTIVQIYSRTLENAGFLAKKVKADFTTDIAKIACNADLYIIAVSDDALAEVANGIDVNNNLIVHTSGSAPMDILKSCSENRGVLYPLQTFSRSRNIDFGKVPLCIEANSIESRERLKNLALSLSENIHFVDSEKRRVLHLAAVFACNFSNFMYTIAQKITEENNLSFDILKPLIEETAAKIEEITPVEAQTGPAVRGDEKIMKLHMDMLRKYPEFMEIYRLISEKIIKGG